MCVSLQRLIAVGSNVERVRTAKVFITQIGLPKQNTMDKVA